MGSKVDVQRIRYFDVAFLGKNLLNFFRQLPKTDYSILLLFRSAHSRLNSYLCRFNATDLPLLPPPGMHPLSSPRNYQPLSFFIVTNTKRNALPYETDSIPSCSARLTPSAPLPLAQPSWTLSMIQDVSPTTLAEYRLLLPYGIPPRSYSS